MITCQQCRRPTQNYLCDDCTDILRDMLEQIPWLIEELTNRIQRLDRTTTGTIGRSRGPDELSVIDFDAATLARTTHKTLYALAETVANIASGRTPRLETVTTGDLALWIACKLPHIVRHHTAGNTYRIIDNLVGADQQGGQLVDAINRQDRTYYGPCTTIVGRDRNGHPRECGHDLYGPRESIEITCPRCKASINPQVQLITTINARDLVTETKLLETLAAIGEPVSRVQLYGWIRTGRLKPRGWVHAGRIVAKKVRHKDPRVFSLLIARQLRMHDLTANHDDQSDAPK